MTQPKDIWRKLVPGEVVLDEERLNDVAESTIKRRLEKDGRIPELYSGRGLRWAINRFWRRVKISSENECWEWQISRHDSKAYGSIIIGGVKWKAHRLSYVLHFGKIPDDLFICHRCDNPKCVNPRHLFSGTALENMRDCMNKGRIYKEFGEQRYCAKLTEEKVTEIKRASVNRSRGFIAQTARANGVSETAIRNIVKNIRWRHVE